MIALVLEVAVQVRCVPNGNRVSLEYWAQRSQVEDSLLFHDQSRDQKILERGRLFDEPELVRRDGTDPDGPDR